MSITFTSKATGKLTPPLKEHPAKVENGDFCIVGNENAPTVGDGINETTTWGMDFNEDINWNSFHEKKPIIDAKLELTLTPKDDLITTDILNVKGLDPIGNAIFSELPVDETSTVCIDLLEEGYGEKQIRNRLGDGILNFEYSDDAILSSAKLKITQECCKYLYVVKYICGEFKGRILAPGKYWTAINVHNPHFRRVPFRYKVAYALPGKSGPISPFEYERLKPDYAMEIDCEQVKQLFDDPVPYRKGFVVIESDEVLDIVAVYSAGTPKEVRTLHTERVHPLVRETSSDGRTTPGVEQAAGEGGLTTGE